MPQKPKQNLPNLFEYRISFRIDQRKTSALRHYLAHNARDALGMFAYAMLKTLFERKDYIKHEFIISREFVKLYDHSLQSPKFKFEDGGEKHSLDEKSKPNDGAQKQHSDAAAKLVQEMKQRIDKKNFHAIFRFFILGFWQI